MEYYDCALDLSTQLFGTVTLIFHMVFWIELKTVAFYTNYTEFRALISYLHIHTSINPIGVVVSIHQTKLATVMQ